MILTIYICKNKKKKKIKIKNEKKGGRFELAITVPKTYPIQPPKIRFVTKICHPNVHFKVVFTNVYNYYEFIIIFFYTKK